MLGGDQSFGLGGYYKTTLEEILPVRSDFEKEKEKPSLAMMLVIDKSGSMGGEKIEMAKEAARAAVELLGPSDKVGVLAFEGENFWVSRAAPLHRQGLRPRPDRRARGRRRHGDGPGDGRGPRDPPRTVAKLKHVIILTDGISRPAISRESPRRWPPTGSPSRPSAMGGDADQQLLEDIARIGNGRYYVGRGPCPGAADLRQGDRHGQQVGDQRAAVPAAGRPADPGSERDQPGRGAARCWAT